MIPSKKKSLTSRLRLALALGCAMLCAAAAAQAPAAAVSGRDAMAPRVLACSLCHGKKGRATPQGYFPRIAGKPAGYLYNQLLNFREGRRSYPQMAYLIEHMTDDYLREIAGHFAQTELPYPPPPAPQESAATRARGGDLVRRGDAARGIPACVACHGAAMTGVAPFIPGLLGLPRDYVNGQLGGWKTGQRHAQAPDCMAQVAERLSPDDVGAISAWLAAQPVSAGGKPAASLPAPLPLQCGGVAGLAATAGKTP